MWFLEPLTALSAMARATERVGLVSDGVDHVLHTVPRRPDAGALDHISGGRAGWNVVTSMFDAEARNHGLEEMPPHDERYSRAAEFVDVALALWDSWAPDALVLDRDGIFADPAKVKPVEHRGKHFLVDGPLNVPHSPQGRPVLFQAGASDQGRDLAARCAEGIYAVAYDLTAAQSYYDDVSGASARRAGTPTR